MKNWWCHLGSENCLCTSEPFYLNNWLTVCACFSLPQSPKPSAASQPVTTSALQSDALFQIMSDQLPNYPDLPKKIKASFLWRLTKGGKVVSEWTTDFTKEPGSVTHGKPSGKPSCTITIADEDFMRIAMGETNPQKLFMRGKVKVAGNIMLAQKLQTLLKEFDLKKVWQSSQFYVLLTCYYINGSYLMLLPLPCLALPCLTLYHIIPYHTMYHTIPCTIPYYFFIVLTFCTILSHHVILTMPCHTVPYCTIL
jgi:putative sterol carrier protein